jgi:hypothetical protein
MGLVPQLLAGGFHPSTPMILYTYPSLTIVHNSPAACSNQPKTIIIPSIENSYLASAQTSRMANVTAENVSKTNAIQNAIHISRRVTWSPPGHGATWFPMMRVRVIPRLVN